VTNTSFVYEDKLLDTVQRVENFTLTLPFLSNLPHDVTLNTAPSLFAKINGRRWRWLARCSLSRKP
jgi:hypothetical protein